MIRNLYSKIPYLAARIKRKRKKIIQENVNNFQNAHSKPNEANGPSDIIINNIPRIIVKGHFDKNN